MKIRDKVLSVDDSKLEKYNVPEWGCDIWLKTMSARERDEFVSETNKLETEADKSAHMLYMFVREEDGSRAFEKDDVKKLADKNVIVIDKILREIMELNGIGGEAIEDAEKN